MRISVAVKPRSRVAAVEETSEGYVVRVKEPPVDNKANEAVVRLLATHFGVPRACVTIIRGQTSRRKVVEVSAYMAFHDCGKEEPRILADLRGLNLQIGKNP